MALLWTEPADVRGRWVGSDPLPEDSQIETLLADAEDTALREFPDLPTRVDADPATVANTIPLLRVKKVIARVVIRHLRNPSGRRTVMETGGPFAEQVTFGGDEPGAMHLTDDDRAELGGALSGAAFTIDQSPETVMPTTPGGWLELGRTYW